MSNSKELIDCWSVRTGIIIASAAYHASCVAPAKKGEVSIKHLSNFILPKFSLDFIFKEKNLSLVIESLSLGSKLES